MARSEPTWVQPSAYEAKLHATVERPQSVIAGRTRMRVLVGVFWEKAAEGLNHPKSASCSNL